MAKAKAKHTTKPTRNDPLFKLLFAITDDLEALDQGINVLTTLGTAPDADPLDFWWIGYRLREICGRIRKATEDADDKHIKPWREAHRYEKPEAEVRP